MTDKKKTILEAVEKLTDTYRKEELFLGKDRERLPNKKEIINFIKDMRSIIFPGYFSVDSSASVFPEHYVAYRLNDLYDCLQEQIEIAFLYQGEEEQKAKEHAEQITERFFANVPEIQRMLLTDLQAGFDGGDIVEGSRRDLLNNQVCLVTWKGSDTKVTDFSNLSLAKNMALADQTVPVGQYTRKALINAGMAGSEYTEVDQLTDDVISKALGGLLINNCANVGAVASAVAEGANEVGTVYYSDTFGYEDQLDIIEQLPNSLTGDVIYPVAAVESDHTSDEELEASEDFLTYLQSEEAVKLFEKYHFTVQ